MDNSLHETLLYLCSGGQAWDAKVGSRGAAPDAELATQATATDGAVMSGELPLVFNWGGFQLLQRS
jgi:hypothetical protein